MPARRKPHRPMPPQSDIVGTFGFRLAEERERKDWSQAQLAEKAKVKRETVARAESGVHTQITLETAVRLADGLGLPLQALLPVREADMAACAAVARTLLNQVEKLLGKQAM